MHVGAVGQISGAGFSPMPLTLRFCISCGADPQVRAGRPRPAFDDGIEIRVRAKKADGGVGRGPGGRPTGKVSGIGRFRLPTDFFAAFEESQWLCEPLKGMKSRRASTPRPLAPGPCFQRTVTLK